MQAAACNFVVKETLTLLFMWILQNFKENLFIEHLKSVLSNFAKFTEKYLCQSFFFNKVAGFSLSKERLWHQRFMWILWSFLEHHFYITPLSDCFCHYEKTEPFISKYLSPFINLKKILEWVKSQKKMSNAFYVQSFAF